MTVKPFFFKKKFLPEFIISYAVNQIVTDFVPMNGWVKEGKRKMKYEVENR